METRTREERWPRDRYPKVVIYPLGIVIGQNTLKELQAAIKQLKRRKTAGQNEVPMELIKEMDDESLEQVREVLNIWWNEEWMEDDAPRA